MGSYHQPVAFPKQSLITNTHIFPLPFASSNLHLCVSKDRLSGLEAAVASNRDAGSEEHLKTISELQAKLEAANAELASEQEKAKKLAVENGKLQYRIIHLVHAIREGDAKSESLKGKNKAKGLSSLASRRGGTRKWNEPPLVVQKQVQKQVQRQSRNWRIYDYELREHALPLDMRIGWQLRAIPRSDKVYVDN
ncbi:hypothetical protein OIU84_011579 [Salix udensis]|uniref:Uncharacterized protein n=1 Tax=Salix udensis TaxID=889485 RepID=A0AAD6JNN0_9ROSI|nr:hypothetical protein OIU84_011579 [Salix udensis]